MKWSKSCINITNLQWSRSEKKVVVYLQSIHGIHEVIIKSEIFTLWKFSQCNIYYSGRMIFHSLLSFHTGKWVYCDIALADAINLTEFIVWGYQKSSKALFLVSGCIFSFYHFSLSVPSLRDSILSYHGMQCIIIKTMKWIEWIKYLWLLFFKLLIMKFFN